jgi:hypothetical protein
MVELPFTIPDKPFTIQLVGSRGSGKSFLIRNILRNTKDRFNKENRFIISPTVLNLDPTLTRFFNEENIFSTYDDSYIEYIISQIMKDRRREEFKHFFKFDKDAEDFVPIKSRIGTKFPVEKYPEFLLVVDDSIGLFKSTSALALLPTRHRHYKLSIIFASQNFKSIYPLVRNNTMISVFFRTNESELKKIADEYNTLDTKEEFIKLFHEKTEKPYGVFIINYFKHGKDIYE